MLACVSCRLSNKLNPGMSEAEVDSVIKNQLIMQPVSQLLDYGLATTGEPQAEIGLSIIVFHSRCNLTAGVIAQYTAGNSISWRGE